MAVLLAKPAAEIRTLAPGTDLHFTGLLIIEARLDVVLTPHLTQSVVDAVDVVPVGIGALSAAARGEAGFIGLLAASKAYVWNGSGIEDTAFAEPGRLVLVFVAREQRISRKVVE